MLDDVVFLQLKLPTKLFFAETARISQRIRVMTLIVSLHVAEVREDLQTVKILASYLRHFNLWFMIRFLVTIEVKLVRVFLRASVDIAAKRFLRFDES